MKVAKKLSKEEDVKEIEKSMHLLEPPLKGQYVAYGLIKCIRISPSIRMHEDK
jgi:hypothetical protein